MIRIFAILLALCAARADESLSLAGEWQFSLGAEPAGKFPDRIQLPGILTAQGFGEIPSIRTEWTGKGWEARDLFREWQADDNFKMPFFLTPPRHYVGPAWYRREVEVPAGWKGRDLRLVLERVHWQSSVWIGGEMIGSANSLGTPHEFTTGPLDPGKHTLTLRIDNRLSPVNPGPLAHSVTDHTQGNWNGVVGAMTLTTLPENRVDEIRVFPSNDGRVKVIATGRANGRFQLKATCGEAVLATSEITADGAFTATLDGKVPFVPELWSEFSPKLYPLSVSLGSGDAVSTRFGFREIANRDGRLLLNGRRAFLRGTLECAIFPLEGHPPTEVEPWKRIIRICKEHGLNHMRFHSWCPPEAAFTAADELGFYFQVEASAWANGEVKIGSGEPVDAWVNAETDRILAEFGNHPSFLLMAYGNEPGGPNHGPWLAGWVERQRTKDPRRLYTTGAGWPVLKGSDFHCALQPRIQGWGQGLRSIINARPPSTDFDWRGYVKQHAGAPVISHETGQWCAYPNFREIEKYTGYFQPRNFEIFRETARRNGILDQADEFLMASGKWQAAAYKHDIEAALRTPGFGGYQLLDLHDFPGQGTALVGVLDAFWDSKGYISAEEFRRFSGPVVPLARMKKLVLTTGESLEAELELAHFGPEDFAAFEPVWSLARGGEIVASGSLPARPLAAGDVHALGQIKVPLSDIAAPAQLELTVSSKDGDVRNSWSVFVYPETAPETPKVLTTTTLDETLAALANGNSVLWLAPPASVADDPVTPLQIGFSPIFWNTAYTDWQPPHTLGLLNRADHPALAGFPTEMHSDWQWWEIVSRSRPFILTPHHGLKPIVQPIDDWVTNRKLGLVFEARVGSGKLLACSADLSTALGQRPAARQLLVSLRNYVASEKFQPTTTLTPDDLGKLIARPPRILSLGATAEATSESRGYEVAKLIDGDHATLWHSEFGQRPAQLPHEVRLRFANPVETGGIILSARKDNSNNGKASQVIILDADGTEIASAEIPLASGRHVIEFPARVTTRGLTVRVVGSHTPPFASFSEIDLLP